MKFLCVTFIGECGCLCGVSVCMIAICQSCELAITLSGSGCPGALAFAFIAPIRRHFSPSHLNGGMVWGAGSWCVCWVSKPLLPDRAPALLCSHLSTVAQTLRAISNTISSLKSLPAILFWFSKKRLIRRQYLLYGYKLLNLCCFIGAIVAISCSIRGGILSVPLWRLLAHVQTLCSQGYSSWQIFIQTHVHRNQLWLSEIIVDFGCDLLLIEWQKNNYRSTCIHN